MQRPRESWCQILNAYAEKPAMHFARSHDLLHGASRRVDRHCKADSDISAAGSHDSGVDPDQLTVQIDKRPARVSRIDRSIRLDEILIASRSETAAAEPANDTGRHRLPEAERITDGEYEVTHFQPIAVAEGQRRESGRALQLENRNVCIRVAADEPHFETAFVLGRRLDVGSVLDHVIVGEDISSLSVHDHTGACG